MMNFRTKTLAILMALCIADMVIPIPIIGLILVYVMLQRPRWFSRLVQECYRIP